MTPFNSDKPSTSIANSPQPDQPSSATLLGNILEQEQLHLEQVVELLKVENEAIVQRNTENMGVILDKKLSLLSKLEQLDSQRQQLFQQLTGKAYNHQEFSAYIAQHSSKKIQQLWQAIKTKLPECRKFNELNGRIINIRQNNTEQILQILSGNRHNTSQTYSQLGQTSLQRNSALHTAV